VVTVADPPNVALGPLAGAAKVTLTPLSGLPPPSLTVACRAVAKAVFTAAFCGVPTEAIILAGTADKFVKLKLAGLVTPATLAVTV